MVCTYRAAVVATLLLVVSGGCARQVLREPNYGIVAIPANTNAWPFRYRDRAHEIMAEHFPGGYDVIREEEYVVGQTVNYHEDQSTGDVEVIDDVLNVSTTETSGSATTTNDTEYRIHYQRRY